MEKADCSLQHSDVIRVMRKRAFDRTAHGFMQLVSSSQLAKRGLSTRSTLLNLGTSQSDTAEVCHDYRPRSSGAIQDDLY